MASILVLAVLQPNAAFRSSPSFPARVQQFQRQLNKHFNHLKAAHWKDLEGLWGATDSQQMIFGDSIRYAL